MVVHRQKWCCTVAENNISIRSWRSWTGGSLFPKTVAAAQNERTIEGPIDWPMIGNCGAGEELDVKTGEEFTSTREVHQHQRSSPAPAARAMSPSFLKLCFHFVLMLFCSSSPDSSLVVTQIFTGRSAMLTQHLLPGHLYQP